ncbi:MAG: 3-dehydroquinate synthase [Deltaproteobacteria bacterium]|nr:MAG: 3-dehydroquinate synthase [Deltaproteobacteria bacterium]
MTPDATVSVPLEGKPYDIFIGKELDSFLKEWLLRIYPGRKFFVIVDDYVFSLYEKDLERLLEGLESSLLSLPVSEEGKNHETLFRIYDFLMDGGADRSSVLLLVGGGVLGDVGGFAAATYMRGVNFVQIPTTLLAQVDSSVGGKTGVNYRDGKNFIGAFHQPSGVFIDVRYLRTLDERNLRSGLAEIIKAGLIGDRTIIDLLKGRKYEEVTGDDTLLVELIRKSVEFKVKVVLEDEREERGVRQVLNFGHTVGHAIEEATGYGRFLHGEAVAVGMAIETQMAVRAGLAAEETRNVLLGLLEDMGFDFLPEDVDYSASYLLFGKDKKKSTDTLLVPVLREIGRVEVREFSLSEFERLAAESLDFLRSFKQLSIGARLQGEAREDVESLERLGRFGDAENLLRKYLQKDPKDERLLLILARLLRKQKRFTESLSVLDEILARNPSCQEAVELRKTVEEEALKEEEITATQPSSSERLVSLGEEVYEIDTAHEGEAGEEEEGEEYPPEEEEGEGIPVYTVPMAEMLLARGEPEKAREVVERILRENPHDRRAENLLLKIREMEEKFSKVQNVIDKLERFRERIREVFR